MNKSCLLPLMILAFLVLYACAPQATPSEPPAAQVAPTETETPAPVPPTLVTSLAGPDMAVGSTFAYVDGSTLVAVPAGEFIMGHGGQDNPEHKVTLSDFWIYRTKVTNRMYALCVKLGKCSPPDPVDNPLFDDPRRSNDPLVGVNYEQAVAYCQFVNGRLPTEAEWEKTARGPDGSIYPWGNAVPACDLLNFGRCVGRTTNVMTYPQGKSYYDALDMAGNVYEWAADWYDPTYYSKSPADDPQGPQTGQKRSVRSTAFNSDGYLTESARRFSEKPTRHRSDLGFRCVVEEPAYFAPFCEQLALYGGGPGGGEPGAAPTPSCPTVSISQYQLDCSNKQSTTNVIFESTDPLAVVDPGTCGTEYDPAPFPLGYNCSAATDVSIQASCTFPDPGPAQCAEHYDYDAVTGLCAWDGAGSLNSECPQGYQYDTAQHCCTVQPGSGLDYPLCPPGASAVEGPPGTFKCLPGDDPGYVQDVLSVTIKTCGGGGPGGCQDPGTCGNYTWDPKQCCCTDSYGYCVGR